MFSRIYELEKKHIKEEDRLKKDMMAKLESVASEFRKASHAQMSATTQRTIRENVVTQSEVSVKCDCAIFHATSFHFCTERWGPGCVKLGEKVAFCWPSAGRRTQLIHLIFTQPGIHLLEHPCM